MDSTLHVNLWKRIELDITFLFVRIYILKQWSGISFIWFYCPSKADAYVRVSIKMECVIFTTILWPSFRTRAGNMQHFASNELGPYVLRMPFDYRVARNFEKLRKIACRRLCLFSTHSVSSFHSETFMSVPSLFSWPEHGSARKQHCNKGHRDLPTPCWRELSFPCVVRFCANRSHGMYDRFERQ